MIIRFFRQNRPDVLGTINTSGTVPEASGTGEPILEAWLKAHEGVSTPDATRQLETFFASWNNPELYSQIDNDVKIPEESE